MAEPAYYNELDKKAAAWLRELIKEDLIPYGHVDDRSIVDVEPTDLVGYAQCHFFAGVGGWGIACRLAGWPDDREIWTVSCPCQPFSVAGKGAGTADERHLWPYFFRLARARRPAGIVGEQVAAAIGKDWFDGVRSDLESITYACRGVVVPACAVNAPHRRDRLFFVGADRLLADAAGHGDRAALHRREVLRQIAQGSASRLARSGDGDDGAVSNAKRERLRGEEPRDAACAPGALQGDDERGQRVRADAGSVRMPRVGDVEEPGSQRGSPGLSGSQSRHEGDSGISLDAGGIGDLANADSAEREAREFLSRCAGEGGERRSDPVLGGVRAWDGARWLISHDGKARRVEPSIPLLVDGLPARAPLLRGYGNAIVPQVAAEVIAALMETTP